MRIFDVLNLWRGRRGGKAYSLLWPLRRGSARKGYFFQASGIWKSRDFASWGIWKDIEICHLVILKCLTGCGQCYRTLLNFLVSNKSTATYSHWNEQKRTNISKLLRKRNKLNCGRIQRPFKAKCQWAIAQFAETQPRFQALTYQERGSRATRKFIQDSARGYTNLFCLQQQILNLAFNNNIWND